MCRIVANATMDGMDVVVKSLRKGET